MRFALLPSYRRVNVFSILWSKLATMTQSAQSTILTSNLHVTDSQKVGFTEFARTFWRAFKVFLLIAVRLIKYTTNSFTISTMRFILVTLKVFNYRTNRTLKLQKSCFYLLQWKRFKSDEKCFLFHVECAIFVQKIFKFLYWLFWSFRKTAL